MGTVDPIRAFVSGSYLARNRAAGSEKEYLSDCGPRPVIVKMVRLIAPLLMPMQVS